MSGRRAAESVVGAAVEAVRDRTGRKIKQIALELLVPGASVGAGARAGVGAVRETAVAVVIIAARITDLIKVLKTMPDIPVIGEAVAEDDDLSESGRALCETLRRGREEDKKRKRQKQTASEIS